MNSPSFDKLHFRDKCSFHVFPLQLLLQFPCHFEFNLTFLVKLAEHTYRFICNQFCINSWKLKTRQKIKKISKSTVNVKNWLYNNPAISLGHSSRTTCRNGGEWELERGQDQYGDTWGELDKCFCIYELCSKSHILLVPGLQPTFCFFTQPTPQCHNRHSRSQQQYRLSMQLKAAHATQA